MKTVARETSIVLMGVSGSGKSTIGRLLAKSIGIGFIDGDDLHSDENKALMAAGIALTDAERFPWLEAIGIQLRNARNSDNRIVITCSALKRTYRDLLRSFNPDIFFVHLDGTKEKISGRISARVHEFMPTTLLDSQFETLEPLDPTEEGLAVAITGTPTDIVDRIILEIS